MPDATWKAAERAIGRILGFTRTGPTGREGPDGITPRLVVQIKHRKSVSAYLKEWVDGIREWRDPERMPIVVLHAKGQQYLHSLVIIRLDDFVEYVKGAVEDASIPRNG